MKRLLYFFVCIAICTFCGPYVTVSAQQKASSPMPQSLEPTAHQQAHHQELKTLSHQQRIERRAQRVAEYEKLVDSIVLSHNFQFNPQSVQMQPAGSMRFLTNPNYTVSLWRNTLDVCLPYWVGYTPPYRYVLLNTVTPSLGTILTKQTDEGWMVSFKATLYASEEFTFTFEINSRYGGATLTISNVWYNPVQYTGTITRIY